MHDPASLHPFVQRQLRRHFIGQAPPESLAPVLRSLSDLVYDSDRERELNAVAMNELSRELEQRYEHLEQGKKRYRLLFDQSPLAKFAVRAIDDTIIEWNHTAEELLGWSADEVMGRNIYDLGFLGPDLGRDAPEKTGRSRTIPPAGLTLDLRVFARDGRRLYTQVSFHNAVLDGEPAVFVHVRDQTAERESQRAQAETEARFRAFFDYAGIAIHVLSFEGLIQEANPASQALLGWTPEELLGRSFTSLSPEEDVDSARDLAHELRTGIRDSITIERRYFHKEGHLVWGQLTISRMSVGRAPRLIAMIQDITERKRMERQLVQQAFQDELTGLANRALFRDRLRHALDRRSRGKRDVAVIMLDLDGFKRVNDSLGHAAGDELLRVTGRRILGTARRGDTVARLGGDEFAVVVELMENGEDLQALADRLLTTVRRPVRMRGRDVEVGVSIGVAVAQPEDDDQAVLRNADVAMYAAKEAGRACVRVFDASMLDHAVKRLEVETDLRLALARRELSLDFQPLIETASGSVRGFEALVRWMHPERGKLSPAGFIDIAEESGLVIALGRWVLHEACTQATRWPSAGQHELSVSVNVAAKQLDGDTLVEDVRLALQESGLDPRRLILEITESDVSADQDEALRKLNALKALGIRLAIDDFGTGYSSLSQLQFFPVDELKIDRSFVSRIEQSDRDAAFVRTIVSLAKLLSMEVVAEGVEDPGQQDFLKAIGCDLGQGYLYSRPIEAKEVVGFLERSRQIQSLFRVEHCRRPAPEEIAQAKLAS